MELVLFGCTLTLVAIATMADAAADMRLQTVSICTRSNAQTSTVTIAGATSANSSPAVASQQRKSRKRRAAALEVNTLCRSCCQPGTLR